MRKQSRRWILASVAAALLLASLFFRLDNEKIFRHLQADLQQSGIELKAEQISLSPLYTGSILLSGVQLKTNTFNMQAKRVFIDLNLAALLTGKPLAQALYIQIAAIDVQHTEGNNWLKLAETGQLKLKRIDISQSEIHLSQQHITLEKVELDIRDIGWNQNPRVELRAHIGDGRIDGHGYLRLKRGKLTQGFGRLKVENVPLTFVEHGTKLETLNGSITTHINPDQSWQSFGHLALQQGAKDQLELRGKLTGNKQQLFAINDMVLNIKDAGALQVSGSCTDSNSCLIDMDSNNLQLSPVLGLIAPEFSRKQHLEGGSLQGLHLQHLWKQNKLSVSGKLNWGEFKYISSQTNSESIIPEVSLHFSGLERESSGDWLLEQADILNHQRTSLSIKNARYSKGEFELPLVFNQSTLWHPMLHITMEQLGIAPAIEGSGTASGWLTLQGNNRHLTRSSFEIDASQAKAAWQGFSKEAQVPFIIAGSSELAEQSQLADFALTVGNATMQISRQQQGWDFKSVTADFNQLKENGVLFPLNTHGYLSGHFSTNADFTDITAADVDMINFGIREHMLSGHIKKQHQKWSTENLFWEYDKNRAYISTGNKGRLNINASKLDSKGIAEMQSFLFATQGEIQCKSLVLPFGIIRDVSTRFSADKEQIALSRFKGTFYEGSLRSKQFAIAAQNQGISFKGALQAGGIRLKDWRWFNKQFQTIIKGNLYSTLNISVDFDSQQNLGQWSGDGDYIVYNGSWLLNNKQLEAKKLDGSFRKREQFKSKFRIKHQQQLGKGELVIDEQSRTSGFFNINDKSYQLSQKWPVPHYE